MKRNFKKAVSLALASTMALSLAACGGTSASTDTTAALRASEIGADVILMAKMGLMVYIVQILRHTQKL